MMIAVHPEKTPEILKILDTNEETFDANAPVLTDEELDRAKQDYERMSVEEVDATLEALRSLGLKVS